MSFLSKIAALFRGSPPASRSAGSAIWLYVRCSACREKIRVRLNRENDLTPEYEEGSDRPTGYLVHKEVVGKNCFRRIQVDITFDANKNVAEQTITGGTFIDEREFDAQDTSPEGQPPSATSGPGDSAHR